MTAANATYDDALSDDDVDLLDTKNDFFHVFQTTVSPYADGFANTPQFPIQQALSFEKIVGNRRSTSLGHPWIFKPLPSELYPNIGRYLSAEELATLALVNRDYRQFARSYQFHTLVFDGSKRSREFLEHLVEDITTHQENEVEGGSIGLCVYRVVVATTYALFAASLPPVKQTSYAEEGIVNVERIAQERREYRKYMGVLTLLFSHCIPNVEVVQWKDPVPMDVALFNAITSSSVRSLQLERLQIRPFVSSKDVTSLNITRRTSLSTLHIDLLRFESGQQTSQEPSSTAIAIHGLLELAAPTCEELILFNACVLTHPLPALPPFARLRRLAVAWDNDPFQLNDNDLLDLLLPDEPHQTSPIRHLELDFLSRNYFSTHRRIPSLTSLVCMFPVAEDVELVNDNHQLESIVLLDVLDHYVINYRLLPQISAAPLHLTTLSLGWLGNRISEQTLRTIGSIVSLKQLWFTVGGRSDLVHDSLVDHVQMRRTLGPLAFLEDLAFSRDSYTTNTRGEAAGSYYANNYFTPGTNVQSLLDEERRAFPPNDFIFDSSLREAAWEKWHRNRMTDEVRQYLKTFPRLSFVYIGQWPLEIAKRGVHGVPTPLSDSRQRDFPDAHLPVPS
ncbi:hypothetical protein SCHPADRAFT_935153 [Schizopora paradoxa]|uniref:F-box domain-containing protein n=1 Tax=Schizopora paradoxa TaxID=27342 RepID=A0A0H2S6R5_9AGAM|nr:hypothetical protein SCHPADRAFT_935153 [Schizopora paradoxa]